MSCLEIVNLGGVCSGDIAEPFLEVDRVAVRDGVIVALGPAAQGAAGEGAARLDAAGGILAPGLIDSHVHTAFGDWTPRQHALGFLDSYTHGGICRVLSASEVHLPGRPSDPQGVKALALLAHKSFQKLRPNGMRVHGGSLILEPGLEEEDFVELAAAGVWQAKAGMGSFSPSREVAPYVRMAHAHGFKVMCHTGGLSIPDSSPVTAADLLEIAPDVAGHVNGGTTSLPDGDLPEVVASGIALQICQAGNLRSALEVVRLAAEAEALDRVLAASDTPTGTGIMPLAVLKTVVELSSLASIPASTAICFATGNVGRAYGLEAGVVEAGATADLIVIDAPGGSSTRTALEAIEIGDLPGIGAVVIEGVVRALPSRNTPPPARMPSLTDPAASTSGQGG